MKKLITLSLLLFAFAVNAQPLQRIQEEENPVYKEVVDNSEYAQLWRKLVDAKHSENIQRYNELLSEMDTKFPSATISNLPSNSPKFCGALGEPTNNDWGNQNIKVYNGAVATGGTNTSAGENPRTIRLRSDSLGARYCAFIKSSRDTLFVYKCTGDGHIWTQIQRLSSGTGFFHSFDFSVTDSANTFKLGFAISIATTLTGTDGQLYFVTMTGTGTPGIVSSIAPTPGGRGLINPSIVSDGSQHSTATTSWYVTYSDYSPSTPLANSAMAAISMNWGTTFSTSIARNTFNDYDLDIDYVTYPTGDSVYVILSNNLTLTNSNLRVRKIALASFVGGTWAQVNPANSSAPEFNSQLCVNRKTGQILCTFTATVSGVDHIGYNYTTPGGPSFNTTTYPYVANFANATIFPSIDVSPWDTTYRVTYLSRGGTFDSLSYAFSNDAAAGFTNFFYPMSIGGSSSAVVAPDVTDYKNGSIGSHYGPGLIYSPISLSINYNGEDMVPVGITNTSGLAKDYSLSQNYPNPFNPSTNIKYSIPVSGFVTLKVYDILGNEVANLVNGNQTSGEYRVDFNTSALNLSSGVYFYKLTAGNFTDVKKMSLIK